MNSRFSMLFFPSVVSYLPLFALFRDLSSAHQIDSEYSVFFVILECDFITSLLKSPGSLQISGKIYRTVDEILGKSLHPLTNLH